MRWFHQVQNYGLGNFIMATPALQLLHEQSKKKVNIFFHDSYISPLYKEANFLNILRKQPNTRPFGTSMRPKKRTRRETDSECLCRTLVGGEYEVPNTYVDNLNTFSLPRVRGKKYVAVFHGCLSNRPVRVNEKDIGQRNRQRILDFLAEKKLIPVLIGNKQDYKQFWKNARIPSTTINYLGKLSLSDSVSVLNQCDCFVSNDTGLYHVAGALRKKGMVFWKDTKMIKNKSTFLGIKHVPNKKNDKKILLDNMRIFFDGN